MMQHVYDAIYVRLNMCMLQNMYDTIWVWLNKCRIQHWNDTTWTQLIVAEHVCMVVLFQEIKIKLEVYNSQIDKLKN